IAANGNTIKYADRSISVMSNYTFESNPGDCPVVFQVSTERGMIESSSLPVKRVVPQSMHSAYHAGTICFK
uniref:Uncharacterized protein n=1 Tax=Amphimedon queenslandica TaxID=400682 RepID=A0A1X7ST62_AMPQE